MRNQDSSFGLWPALVRAMAAVFTLTDTLILWWWYWTLACIGLTCETGMTKNVILLVGFRRRRPAVAAATTTTTLSEEGYSSITSLLEYHRGNARCWVGELGIYNSGRERERGAGDETSLPYVRSFVYIHTMSKINKRKVRSNCITWSSPSFAYIFYVGVCGKYEDSSACVPHCGSVTQVCEDILVIWRFPNFLAIPHLVRIRIFTKHCICKLLPYLQSLTVSRVTCRKRTPKTHALCCQKVQHSNY